METDEQLKLMAATIYELRLLLAKYVGSEDDAKDSERLAAHLVYALHNDALAILEGDGTFDVNAAIGRIKHAEVVVGREYADGFGVFSSSENA